MPCLWLAVPTSCNVSGFAFLLPAFPVRVADGRSEVRLSGCVLSAAMVHVGLHDFDSRNSVGAFLLLDFLRR